MLKKADIIGDVLFGKLCAGKKLAFAYTLFSVIVGAIIYYLVLSIILWLKFPSDDLKHGWKFIWKISDGCRWK